MCGRLVLAVLLLAGLASAQTTHQVNQVAQTFNPANIVINHNDTVQWNYNSGLGHTVTEGVDPIVDGSEAFHSVLNAANPIVIVNFTDKFIQQNPRPGHVYPYVCIPHFAFGMSGTVTVLSPWENLGFNLPGNGDPFLWGEGPLTPGSGNALRLENAFPSSPGMLFVGLFPGSAPFKGGILVPVPPLLQIPLGTDPLGSLNLPFLMPPGVTGLDLFLQQAILDPGAPVGVSLSNAVKMTGQ
ncbi:MAG: cupredoxin domain-containing protein [Planctomycetota bacterium]|jgi:plastocyanin